MPTFQYEAVNEAGQTQKGTVSAKTSEEAISRIRADKLFPRWVREQKVKRSKGAAAPAAASGGGTRKKKKGELSFTIGGVKQKPLTAFTRQLSTLQDAGLPILRSLAILEQQQKPGLLKNILGEVHDDVSGGATLSEAMGKHPKAFDKLYSKMIAAGEVGGVLDQILQRLAEFMEKSARLKARIKSAMIYPIVVISVAVVIVSGIMILIIPKFEDIFSDFDTTLPGLTMFLIAASKWMAGTHEGQAFPGAVVVALSPFIIFFAIKLIRKTDGGRYGFDMLALNVPVIGTLVAKTSIARFTRTLGTLIRAGVPILDAIMITRDTSGNAVYQRALTSVHDSVRQGESFAEPLRKAKVCDSIVTNMIDVGEETGDLDKMLVKVADNYDEEVDTLVSGLVSLLEPVMVVVLGGIVGVIVVSLFLPLVKLMESVMN